MCVCERERERERERETRRRRDGDLDRLREREGGGGGRGREIITLTADRAKRICLPERGLQWQRSKFLVEDLQPGQTTESVISFLSTLPGEATAARPAFKRTRDFCHKKCMGYGQPLDFAMKKWGSKGILSTKSAQQQGWSLLQQQRTHRVFFAARNLKFHARCNHQRNKHGLFV